MAAPDFTVSSPGQVNGAGDNRALYLKVYAGEVLKAFNENNVMASRHIIRTISSGKQSSFPATGKAVASYHTPGTTMTGQTINGNERVITIDDMLVSPVFMANVDDALTHFDVRSEYAKQAGASIAREFDKNALKVAILAARATATVTGLSGGTALTVATARTNADNLVAALFDAAQALDEKDVPAGDRFCALTPDMYYLLVNSSSKAIHRDYLAGANGSIADGTIMNVAGISIVKTNNLPTGVVSTGPTAYQGTFTNTACVVWHRSAIGTVKLRDLSVESGYQIAQQGTLLVAKALVGHGVLRPEAAVEIKVA